MNGFIRAVCLFALQASAISALAATELASPAVELAVSTRQAVNRDGEHALAEFTLLGGMQWKPAQDWRLRARVRAVAETKLEPTSFRSLEWDEGFVEHVGDACSIRAGRQTVVWGSADRLRVLDIVHSQDLREGVFGDPSLSRLPLAMLNIECASGAQSLQWLLIPEFRANRTPQPGGRFYVPNLVDLLAAAKVPVAAGEKPDWKDPADWSAGVKWAGRWGPADVSLNAFHGWQTSSTARLVSASTPTGLAYEAGFSRLSMIGASVAAPVGPLVLKAEASVFPNAMAYYRGASGSPDATPAGERRVLGGVDYQAARWFFATQYYVQQTRSDLQLVEPAWQRIVTLAARREFLQGRLNVTSYIAHDLTRPAQFLSLQSTYELGAKWQASAGLDLFRGDPTSFGRFRPESRLVLGLRR